MFEQQIKKRIEWVYLVYVAREGGLNEKIYDDIDEMLSWATV